MGVPGPGGPCSEIYYDRGPEHGVEGGPVADEDRYLEVWNLVFMQDELSAVRSKMDFDIRRPTCRRKNIDTGMGLERMAALLQGVDNIYEIDTTRAILDRAGELSGARYGADAATTTCACASWPTTPAPCAFLMQDGVLPGNEGRGYVLRRILRRVIRNMRLLGSNEPVMGELIDASVDAMGPQYPELVDDLGRLAAIAVAEEEVFAADAAHRHHDLRHRGGRRAEAGRHHARGRRRPSRCTTPTASRSTSPSRWRPRRASRSTRTASAAS